MSQYSPQGFKVLPPVVKNLLIINVIVFIATVIFAKRDIYLEEYFSLYFFQSEKFHVYQYITYMFMHANISHLFFNMFALWMFGYVLENYWGSKRFFIFYITCGLGAAFVHTLVMGFSYYGSLSAINVYAQNPDPEAFVNLLQQKFSGFYRSDVLNDFVNTWNNASSIESRNYGLQSVAMAQDVLQSTTNIPTVGASGAVYGVLLAFGLTFPEERIYLYFLVPIKAKWFVIFYIAIELFEGVLHTGDGVAHFAHLGGMIFGYILIRYWRKKRNNSQWTWNE